MMRRLYFKRIACRMLEMGRPDGGHSYGFKCPSCFDRTGTTISQSNVSIDGKKRAESVFSSVLYFEYPFR